MRDRRIKTKRKTNFKQVSLCVHLSLYNNCFEDSFVFKEMLKKCKFFEKINIF